MFLAVAEGKALSRSSSAASMLQRPLPSNHRAHVIATPLATSWLHTTGPAAGERALRGGGAFVPKHPT